MTYSAQELHDMDALATSASLIAKNPTEKLIAELMQGAARVAKDLDEAVGILRDFHPMREECHFDHHGYCQAHNWFGEGECRESRAKKLLERLDAE